MFLNASSYVCFQFPDCIFIPSEHKNWISLYTQWRGKEQTLQNIITSYQFTLYYIPKRQESSPVPLQTCEWNASVHTIIVL